MSSIKKVLCLKVNKGYEHLFTAGKVYDVTDSNDFDISAGTLHRVVTDATGALPANIVIGGFCIYGEWQPLEQYVCVTNLFTPTVKFGDHVFGYEDHGALRVPRGCDSMVFSDVCKFKKLNEDEKRKPLIIPRHEVRHVVYDTKDNEIVNDAMGECYITLAEAQEVCDEMNAPKVMKPKYTKEVEYFGMKLLVPDDVKSIAAHKDGGVYVSNELMCEALGAWETLGYLKHICIVDLNGIDWKETLVEIK